MPYPVASDCSTRPPCGGPPTCIASDAVWASATPARSADLAQLGTTFSADFDAAPARQMRCADCNPGPRARRGPDRSATCRLVDRPDDASAADAFSGEGQRWTVQIVQPIDRGRSPRAEASNPTARRRYASSGVDEWHSRARVRGFRPRFPYMLDAEVLDMNSPQCARRRLIVAQRDLKSRGGYRLPTAPVTSRWPSRSSR